MKNLISKITKKVLPLVVSSLIGFNAYSQDTVKTNNGYEIYNKTDNSDKKDHSNHTHVVSQKNYDNIQKYDNQDRLTKEICILQKKNKRYSVYTRLFEYDDKGNLTKDVTVWDENGDGEIKGIRDTKTTWIYTYDSMVKFNKKGRIKKAVLISAL